MVARLRANGLVPAGIPVRLVQLHEGTRSGGWKWRAEHASSGDDLAVGSRYPVSTLFEVRHWEITREPLGVHVGPGSEECLASHSCCRESWQGPAWRGKAWLGAARHGKARRGKVR